MGYVRTRLVPVHGDILSSYQRKGSTGGPRETLRPLVSLGSTGTAPADVAGGLRAAHIAVTRCGGDFRVTDLNRDPAISNEARAKFLNWQRAGEPPRGSADWDPDTMKDAYVSPGGYSMHNADRAIDLHIELVQLRGVDADKQLDELWEILEPIGWTPIIKHPKEGATESWHFNYFGEWAPVHRRFGSERVTAMCAGLDIGLDCYDRWEWKFVQAQLHRAGYNVGEIDGWPGRKADDGSRKMGMTRQALRALGFNHVTDKPASLFEQVSKVPSSPLIWTP